MTFKGGTAMDVLFLLLIAGLTVSSLALIGVCGSLLGEKP